MPESSRQRHAVLALLLAALATLGPFSIDTFLPAMADIGVALSASPLQMQQALSVYLFCYALMMLWHGAISDSVGRRPVILVSCLCFAIASVGCAMASDLSTLLLFRGMQGLCGGAGLVVGRAIIRDRFHGHDAQRMMSQVTMLFSVSPAIAPVVGGLLFGSFGWRSIFVFMALLGLLLFAACWRSLPETLAREGASSEQELDDDRARVRSAQAALKATQAQAQAAGAAIVAARTQVAGAESAVKAADATVQRINADLADSELAAPRDGRVQLRLAQPGEVLGGGGKLLNLVDLTDVYMSFFLPETVAGRVALGTEVRIVLDAAPQYVIPAKVSFVASTAQFTPKTVETASERQKLMFRVRARIAPELLRKHITQVKTGLPGQAWIKLDEGRDWPAHLHNVVAP